MSSSSWFCMFVFCILFVLFLWCSWHLGGGPGMLLNILQCTEWPSLPQQRITQPKMEIMLRLKNPGPHNKHNKSRGRETTATVRIFITNFKLSMKGMKDSLRKNHKISTNNNWTGCLVGGCGWVCLWFILSLSLFFS